MPNWCSYGVTFYGTEEAIKELDKAITLPKDDQHESWNSDGIHDLTLVYPVPEDLNIMSGYMREDDPDYDKWVAKKQANLEKYHHETWYSWRVMHWGTKWAPSVLNHSVLKSSLGGNLWTLHVDGESAWSPPSELIEHITGQHPVSAIMTYQEDGMCFAGAEAYLAGDQTYNGYFEYSVIPDLDKQADKLNAIDDSDEWQEAWDDYNDAIRSVIDQREMMAFQSLQLQGWAGSGCG